jgi:glutathione S-transferase
LILIGMFDSPFVRRVAASLNELGIAFEHRDWSVGRDFERIRAYNPLGQVPTLIPADAVPIVDSGAILDYLDGEVEPARRLMPAGPAERRAAFALIALALGAADKCRTIVYEQAFRPAERRHPPWVERCDAQMHGALAALERECEARAHQRWLIAGRVQQPDLTLACAASFIADATPLALAQRYPALAARVAHAERLPSLARTRAAWSAPGG